MQKKLRNVASRTSLLAGASLTLMAFSSTLAMAQQQGPIQAQASGDDLEVEEIVITGSRIARTNRFETLAPTQSIGEDEFDKRGFTNIADALNELPAFANSTTPDGGNNGFAGGVNFANLFGLGSARTLTLVDGKRFVSGNPPTIFGLAGGSQVDLNVIPTALIANTDVVGVGGAPTYGSDAIAGTINVIMKDDYEGFEISGQYSTIQNGGDPEDYQVQAAWGSNSADGRGNVAIGVEYNRNEGAKARDFDEFGAKPGQFFSVPASMSGRDADGDGINDPIRRLFDDPRISTIGAPGNPIIAPTEHVIPNGAPFGLPQDLADSFSIFPGANGIIFLDENGDIQTQTGTIIPGEALRLSNGNGLDLDAFGQRRGFVERVSSFATAHYDVYDWLKAYGQFTFANSESRTVVGQGNHQTSLSFADESQSLALPITTPFLKDDVRQQLIDFGAGDTFFVIRNLNDVDEGRLDETESFTWRFVGGLQGDFEFKGRKWNYDASFNWGQSDVDAIFTGINDGRFFNAIDAIALTDDDIQSVADFFGGDEAAAHDELNRISGTDVNGVGDIVCRAVLEAARGNIPLRQGPAGSPAANDVRPDVDGCVPLNLLGLAGPQEAIDFVRLDDQSQSDLNQRVFNINVGGEVIELPAGWVQMVAGYESRRERGSFRSGAAFKIGLGRNAPILDTRGEFSTDEGFFELVVPAISPDMKFGENLLGFTLIDRLTLEGQARVVNNSLTGQDTVWTGGGRIAFGGFLSDLAIRGNFTQSTRSPSIQELFSPQTDTFSFADDPCDFEFLNSGPDDAPDNRRINCASLGFDEDFNSFADEATVQGRTGGNPNLDVERADAFTIGGTFTPRWIPGLLLNAEFIQVNISNRITNLTLTNQLEACFDQDPSSFNANEGICTTFQRDANGQIIDFLTGFQNAASSRFKAISMEAEYSFDLTSAMSSIVPSWGRFNWGSVSTSARAFHRMLNEFSVIGEPANRTIGNFGEPKWNGTYDFTWTRGPARFFWRVVWQDSSELDPEGNFFFEDRDGNLITKTGARILNNTSASYTFFDVLTAQISVDNVLNREATDIQIAANDFSNSEIFGRTYRFRLTARF